MVHLFLFTVPLVISRHVSDAEFRRQLGSIQSLLERIPQCIIHHLLQAEVNASRSELMRLHAEFLGFHSECLRQKVSRRVSGSSSSSSSGNVSWYHE